VGGEQSWRRILFDTNMVSRWMDGDEDFRPPLKGFINRVRKRGAVFFVSAVTTQELMVHAIRAGAEQQAKAFLQQHFTALELDERAALFAARLGAALPPARGSKQGERDLWQRDVAILGTAVAHDIDAVVTANGRDFLPFRDHVPYEIVVIEPLRRRGR
jgi:predicted nucleic acid-binding protein